MSASRPPEIASDDDVNPAAVPADDGPVVSDDDFFTDFDEEDVQEESAAIQYIVDAESDEADEEEEEDEDYETVEDETGADSEPDDDEDYEPGNESVLHISQHQLMSLQNMMHAGGTPEQIRQLLTAYGFTLTESGITAIPRERPRRDRPRYEWPAVPNPAGRKLMYSGKFGYNHEPNCGYKSKQDLHSQLMKREIGLESPKLQRTKVQAVAQTMTPSAPADVTINFDKRGYSGQFSDDGNLFFTCNQDSNIRLYDTSDPYHWKYYKAAVHSSVAWTISDASLSPDNKWLASCSLESNVYLHSTEKNGARQARRLDLARSSFGGYRDFGIFSIRFGNDGRELVAGTSSHEICVYDIEASKTVLRINAHHDDVNAVCYGEASSPHILYSGSDDTTVKVWDRRSLGENRPAGVFLGHTEGVTYIDSKGDGRYIISNSKDQTMKLWDIRKSIVPDEVTPSDMQPKSHFDYRWEYYNERSRTKPNQDCSLVTFSGHKVLYTLIRCHFSPQGSSDGRYVYSGSADGKVYIWNLDGTIKGTIPVGNGPAGSSIQSQTKVRDASWHPCAPVIAATSWNGGGGHNGTCTVHSWRDGEEDEKDGDVDVGPGLQLNAKLEAMQRQPVRAYNEFEGW